MSIRLKLILLVCLMTVLPASIIGVVAYRHSRNALEEKIQQEFEARRSLLTHDINNCLSEFSNNIEAWSKAAVMSAIKINDVELEIEMFILHTKKAYPIIKEITVFNSKEKVVASTSQSYMEDNQAKHTEKSVAERFPVASTLAGKTTSMIGGSPDENFTLIPIHDVVNNDGSIVGAMLVEIDRRNLDEIILAANRGKNEFNEVNAYLTSEGREIATLNEPGIAISQKDLFSGGEIADGFHDQKAGDQNVVYSSANIGKSLIGITNDLRLTVLQPDQMAFRTVTQLATFISILSFTLVAVFVGIGAWFARTISLPILNLKTLSDDIIKSSDLSRRVTVQSSDEIGGLATSFNHLLSQIQESQLKLEEYNKSLEIKISERTQAIRTILDHATFGLFICDSNLKVNEGYSKTTLEILGCQKTNIAGTNLVELMGLDTRIAEHFTALYEQIFDPDSLLGGLSVDQLPTRFVLKKNTVSLTGSVVHNESGTPTGVLFCLANITDLVNAEQEIERNRSLIKMLRNRDTFRQFIGDIKSSFENIYRSLSKEPAGEDLVRRELHTIKGNSTIFELRTIAYDVHVLEDESKISKQQIVAIENKLKDFLSSNHEMLGIGYGEKAEDSYVVSDHLLKATESHVFGTENINQIRDIFSDFVRRIRLKRARTVLGPIEEAITQLANRMGKQVQMTFEGSETLVPQELNIIFKTLPHLLRNSIDHGVEMPEQRNQKSETASIALRVTDLDDRFEIVIQDDGKGIDVARVGQKALESGIIKADMLKKMSNEDIMRLIFSQGVSTAQDVTDISGRGIGMSSVLEAVESVYGEIKIQSKPNQGTSFTIHIPKPVRLRSTALQESPIMRAVG